ncbi:MAG: hypothetical protein WAU78_00875 [Roseiarcus sp.]
MLIAALYVETGGVYFGVDGVDPWDEDRDARHYPGPYRVVAHPPCQRWGRFWHGSTRKPHQFQFGDDKGCFKAALAAVRCFGGVLEHPADSGAWNSPNHPTRPGFGLPIPERGGGWTKPDEHGGRSCCVDQGHYGHKARKRTWLYAAGIRFPDLIWGACTQRIPQWMIDRYGYAKARKIGVIAMEGGKDKQAKRSRSPIQFRDLLIEMSTDSGNG